VEAQPDVGIVEVQSGELTDALNAIARCAAMNAEPS
jgi:hypothetical protein